MIETNNPGHGFFGTYAQKKGEESARKAWAVAFEAIAAAIPSAKPEEVRNYLDSVYGRHTADEVLNGTPVARQVEFRRARLVRHFAEIQRQTARGAFED
ncbi:hypothetical protein PAE1_72 [Pseudomonas phage PAE1]|uniref:Uncharacterized protein n=1 Tax=Pseudomonas phage PAE1 TaxID=1718273 RepID=A0A0N9ERG4_9CAUD|nr:hypothetical protein PAE1_72 [Pseudomonas phage PAE1]ALF51572.1 hypothetical protein PAE1_72 [Pseudomonas phage PAE1]